MVAPVDRSSQKQQQQEQKQQEQQQQQQQHSDLALEEPWMVVLEAMVHADPRVAVEDDDETVVVVVGHVPGAPQNNAALHLALLSCENQPPYRPALHTAQLFVDLLVLAAEKAMEKNDQKTGSMTMVPSTIRVHIFDAQAGVYPTDWDKFDGIILPGSFSSAYDTDAWIATLKRVIQTHIVAPQRPTLAVCFGHQILAHSFLEQQGGKCIPTPTGPRAGRYTTTLTAVGQQLLLPTISTSSTSGDDNDEKAGDDQKKHLELYYTHNDMVSQLPPGAVSLASSCDGTLPVLAAAYYGTRHDKGEAEQDGGGDEPRPNAGERPYYAISFQAHPEYATSLDLGVYRTFHLCCAAMEQRHSHLTDWRKNNHNDDNDDPASQFERVQEDSINAIVAACRLLGWFP